MNKLANMAVPGLRLPLGRFEAAFFARLAIEVRARKMTRRRLAEWREAAEQHECFTSGAARAACEDAVAAVDHLRATGLKPRAIKRRVLMLDRLVRRRDRYHRDSALHVLNRASSRLLRDFVRKLAITQE